MLSKTFKASVEQQMYVLIYRPSLLRAETQVLCKLLRNDEATVYQNIIDATHTHRLLEVYKESLLSSPKHMNEDRNCSHNGGNIEKHSTIKTMQSCASNIWVRVAVLYTSIESNEICEIIQNSLVKIHFFSFASPPLKQILRKIRNFYKALRQVCCQ